MHPAVRIVTAIVAVVAVSWGLRALTRDETPTPPREDRELASLLIELGGELEPCPEPNATRQACARLPTGDAVAVARLLAVELSEAGYDLLDEADFGVEQEIPALHQEETECQELPGEAQPLCMSRASRVIEALSGASGSFAVAGVSSEQITFSLITIRLD